MAKEETVTDTLIKNKRELTAEILDLHKHFPYLWNISNEFSGIEQARHDITFEIIKEMNI